MAAVVTPSLRAVTQFRYGRRGGAEVIDGTRDLKIQYQYQYQ